MKKFLLKRMQTDDNFFYSDIFDAMSLVKHNAGEIVIQQGMDL